MNCKGECRGPGYYSKLITIQKLKTSASLDAAGHVDRTSDSNWETHTKAYANVQTRGGREFYRAQKTEANQSHLWTVRSTEKIRSVTPEMRIKWDNRIFNVLSAQDKEEARIESEISTQEAV